MSEFADKALLPAGMCDVLPPEAENEALTTQRLMGALTAYGYEHVKPPLIEFEDSLLTGNGAAMAEQTLRLPDPVSQKMMGVRADMTLQVARIATTRLNKAPRPLRLCYAGQVLRVRGTQLRPERQFGQVGAELIGSNDATADAEVIIIGIQALQALGIGELSVDIAMPSLVSAILNDLDLDKDAENETRSALDRKDSAAVGNLTKALGDKTTTLLTDMLAATGERAVLQNQIDEELREADPKFFDILRANPEMLAGQRNERLAEIRQSFVTAFGNVPRDPEVEFSPTVKASLFLMNEQTVLGWLDRKPGNLVDRLAKMTDYSKLANELYLSVMSRLPSDEERIEVAKFLTKRKDNRDKAIGHLAWALLASTEFRLNH